MSDAPDTGLVTRFPTPQRFRDVVRMNEDGGGGRRSYDACTSTAIPYKLPDGRVIQMSTTACNEEARIKVNYRREDGSLGFADVCVNDDAVHLWPRFSDEARGRPVELD